MNNTPYWTQMETQPNFDVWLGFYEGCVLCGCDHGCNQWIAENHAKISLAFRIMRDPKATTKLDKLSQLPLKRADAIWIRLMRWGSEKFNRELRQHGES